MFQLTKNMSASILVITFCFGCSSVRKQASEATQNRDAETARATAMSGGSEFSVIEFKKGSHAITEQGKQTLARVAKKASAEGREIDEIKVLAWADREYPAAGTKADRSDITLADNRASAIKTYLKDDLDADFDVQKHNMAQRPGALSELVKTEDYEVKNNFESTGASGSSSTPEMLGEKVSKAIVVVEYE